MKKRIILSVVAVGIFFTTVSFKNDFFEIAKQIEIFTTLFKELNMNYVDETNPAELMDTAIKSMLTELDPYTKFYNEQDVETARIRNSGEYTGIGASVKTRDDKITIIEPHKGYPADNAGLKAGDEIIKIGDIVLSDFDSDAGELLKGSPGSEVQVTYLRQGKQETTTLKRGKIDVEAVPYYKLLEDKTGYIVLSKFNAKASTQVIDALKTLKADGADKIILDLRGNPGGLLSEAINVTNIFIPKGELVTTTKSVIKKYNRTYVTKNEPVDTEIPLVVLIDGRSASASEIVSGGLQDYDRAVIVGARSFGKGLVQRPKQLTYGTQLKVTISRYYTPSGRCIQALDYWNRDEDGNAVRTKSAEYNEFKTKAGRSVFDGGGVLPDVQLETSKFSGVTSALVQDEAIFNFATNYYYTHKLESPEDFKFTSSDFSDFKEFLKTTNFKYTTQTEKELKETLEIAVKEEFDDDVQNNYNNFLASIQQAKTKAIDDKKPEIERLITDEIIKRYFYKEGLYDYYVINNPEIEEAKNILNSTNRYSKILK
ncbi:S41 family peptidase [Croceibacter atlanticus]|jgi:carboxyl-terminal processing protease|uniref:Carboxy-terminal processing protease n=1 Tax=Croceibacter atlanticus (strain ATCC BAA-628 / JCM 21780 / CIP 108009 / IAM 15332 / KCTC 12090 / HTCC2559) TaxID=216432 RepID=A3U644_CROAH|nr:S41 family peptidase [Croceibacter atlanticus]EAP87711.1 carboxy-terminal processing protease precursor [Croceibacter atlanticus HTCC2559]MBW4970056.1 S41 family peptidase [Croceibacter atlanticus]